MNSEDLDQRFAHHPPKPGQAAQYARIRRAARDFAELILEETAQNPGCVMAIAKVDEAVFWANSSIARYGEAEVPGAELAPISLKFQEHETPMPEMRPIIAGGNIVPGPSINEVKFAVDLVFSLAHSRVNVHVSADDVLGWTDEQRGLATIWARCTILKFQGYHVGVPARPEHLSALEPAPKLEPRICQHEGSNEPAQVDAS